MSVAERSAFLEGDWFDSPDTLPLVKTINSSCLSPTDRQKSNQAMKLNLCNFGHGNNAGYFFYITELTTSKWLYKREEFCQTRIHARVNDSNHQPKSLPFKPHAVSPIMSFFYHCVTVHKNMSIICWLLCSCSSSSEHKWQVQMKLISRLCWKNKNMTDFENNVTWLIFKGSICSFRPYIWNIQHIGIYSW